MCYLQLHGRIVFAVIVYKMKESIVYYLLDKPFFNFYYHNNQMMDTSIDKM